MRKLINSILAVFCSLFSVAVFSLTCPEPSSIQYVNKNWVAPDQWYFNQLPEGGADDEVGSFKVIEWQAIISGGSQGSIDWCQYDWKVDKGYSPVSIAWGGMPMFFKIDKIQYWTQLSPSSNAYYCTSSRDDCSVSPA